jgi:hypothetical protein
MFKKMTCSQILLNQLYFNSETFSPDYFGPSVNFLTFIAMF